MFVKKALVNRIGLMEDKDGMDTLSMVVSILGRSSYGLASPIGS